MKISNIHLKNFRCYEDISLNLEDDFTLLIGTNGVGKTAILDGIAKVLSMYTSNFSKGFNLKKDDVLYSMHQVGSKIEREHQFPLEINGKTSIYDKDLLLSCTLKDEKSRGINLEKKAINSLVLDIRERVRKGDLTLILPVIAYYRTSRVFKEREESKRISSTEKRFSRLQGYLNSLNASSNGNDMLTWFEEMTYLELQEKKEIPELEVVKKAMSKCYISVDESIENVNFFFNLKSKELEINIKYLNSEIENLPLRLLSDGIKSTLSIVGDIAYRMAVLNPQLLGEITENTPGIVLIDEIDMHLHPKWQKKIIGDLCEIFPKVQFIFTTHSPNILANIHSNHVRVLSNNKIYLLNQNTFGKDVDRILSEIMSVNIRPELVSSMIEEHVQKKKKI